MSWGLWGYDRTAAVVPGSTIFRGIDLSDLPGELSSRVHHAINQGSPDRNLHDNLLDHVGDNHGFSGWWTDDPDNAKHYAAGGHQDDNPLRAVLATDWNGEGQDYDYIDDEVGDDDVPLRDEPPRPHTVWVSRPGSPWVNISKGVPGPEERTAGANGDLPEGMIITRKDYPRYGESSWHAHHNGQEIGSLYVMPSDYSDKGAVGDINVHDDYLRRGVGTALWEAAGRPLHTPGQQTGKGKAWAQAVGGDNDFNVAWNPDDDVYDPSDYGEDYEDSPFYTAPRTAMPGEDYRGSHRPGGPDHGAPFHDLNQMWGEDIYEHPEWYDSMDYGIKNIQRQLNQARGNPDHPVVIYRASPPGITDINTGDWVTTSLPYARAHAEQSENPKEDFPIVRSTVPAKHVWTNNDLHEWGYHGPNVRGEVVHPDQTKKARTMTAAVTVYTQPSCVQCTMTRKQLDKLGIEHRVVDVTADPEAHAYVTGLGYTAAPVVVVNDGEEHWAGFRPDRLKGLTG